MIVFMVNRGFSLRDLRKLYIDEFYDYAKNLIYVLEKRGEIKEGTYSKINEDDSTVNQLRSALKKLKRNG